MTESPGWRRFRLGLLGAWGAELAPESGAPVVVFHHGAGGQAASYRQVIGQMSAGTDGRLSALAVNQPGHGSEPGSLPTSIIEMAENLELALSVLARPVILVGHSMGGAVAIETALRGKAPLAGLVLYSTGARLRVSPQIFTDLRDNYHTVSRESARFSFGPGVTEAILDHYLALPRHPDNRPALSDFAAADRFDRMEAVKDIGVPALVIGGSHDRLTPPKYQQYLAERIPVAERVILEGAGHQGHLEMAAEFVRAVVRFAQRNGTRWNPD
ncbi:MAG: alpha/beta hydrolase [Deltaproteobacteria bacterium]|nr:alpha/beta hydrolase [Deltaproteobacteria bacterium]